MTTAGLPLTKSLPLPLIDHAVVNVGVRMAEAAEQYGRLGFTLTPLGRHTLGSINHLAMFGHDYIEILGIPGGGNGRADVIADAEGLAAIAFATEDADHVHAALAGAGVPVEEPLAFARPVALPEGICDARFRVTRLAADATPAGRLFFCAHQTRNMVWRDEWRRHANGALGVRSVVIAAARPETPAALFARMFGAEAVVDIPGGKRLTAGLANIDILAPEAVARRYGAAALPSGGREAAMVALVLRTASLALTATAVRSGGIEDAEISAARVLVPARAAMGAVLEFVAD